MTYGKQPAISQSLFGVGGAMLRIVMWAAIAGVALVALGRLIAHDRYLPLVWANSYSLYVFVLPLLTIPVAWAMRRRRLALVSAVALAFGVFWVAPDFWPVSQATGDFDPGSQFTLLSANLYVNNSTSEALLNEILATEADVVLLQEYSPRWHRLISQTDMFDKYPYRQLHVSDAPYGNVILSRLPLVDSSVWWVEGNPMSRAIVRVGPHVVHLICWHATAPQNFHSFGTWTMQYRRLLAELGNESGPLVVAGDFNATQHSRWLRELSAAGFRSAHAARGRGLATTYPNGHWLMLPIRIDHILYSRGVECRGIGEGKGTGSDHKPLLAKLGVMIPPDVE